ncbi:TLC domain containing protein [Nitzschia inconspicua]|uniref:TLC domain containing protein n=1 Tax=Nitzschia inconspicua TaxID=303405 RepID=A0A9K3L3U8_9STRA|nr:TLC domain containing protein [Nitzschia inconspicua]
MDVKGQQPKRQQEQQQQQIAESAAVATILVYVTSLQHDPSCRTLIAATTTGYATLYVLLGHVAKQQLLCSNDSDSSSWTFLLSPEAKSRFLSTVNAVVLTMGSLLCFTEWQTYQPEVEGWIGNSNKKTYPPLFAAIFVAFLHFDLLWMVWHRHVYKDVSALIHHVLFVGMTHFVLSGPYFLKPFAWLSLTELSTPFLNLRWYYAIAGQKSSNGYLYTSLAFAGTFLATRVVGYSLGLWDVLRSYQQWRSIRGLHAVTLGLMMGYLLNLFWAVKIVHAVRRVRQTKKNNSNKRDKIPNED